MNNKSEKEKLPYENEGVDYIYGMFDHDLVVLPLEIIWDLINTWEKVKKCYDEKLTFSQSKKIFKDYWRLESYCEKYIDGGDGEELFLLCETYQIDTDFCNEYDLMESYLPNDLLEKDFVEHSYTGYGEKLIIIKSKDEKKLLDYFSLENKIIINDYGLITDAIGPEWFLSDYV